MIQQTMTMIVANPLVGFFFFFFFFNFFYHFSYNKRADPYFHWNLVLPIQNIDDFHCNNIVSAKNKKEETTNIFHPYLNLALRGVKNAIL